MLNEAQTVVENVGPYANYLTPIAVGGGLWWFRRFVDRTEKKIDKLVSQVADLQTKAEVANQATAFFQGQLDSIAGSVKETDRSIGVTNQCFEKLWGFLHREFGSKLPTRLSDDRR